LDNAEAVESVVRAARSERPDLTIVARARDAAHASKLYDLKVTDAVPETIEASLQLSEAALIDIGIRWGWSLLRFTKNEMSFVGCFRHQNASGMPSGRPDRCQGSSVTTKVLNRLDSRILAIFNKNIRLAKLPFKTPFGIANEKNLLDPPLADRRCNRWARVWACRNYLLPGTV
jgi:hypothetical protein